MLADAFRSVKKKKKKKPCNVLIKNASEAGLVHTASPCKSPDWQHAGFSYIKTRDWLALLGNTKESSAFVYRPIRMQTKFQGFGGRSCNNVTR